MCLQLTEKVYFFFFTSLVLQIAKLSKRTIIKAPPSERFSVIFQVYFQSHLDHFPLPRWWNILSDEYKQSQQGASAASHHSADEHQPDLCCSFHSVIFSVSHTPCLCGLAHSVMIMRHDTVVRLWRVSYLTFDSMTTTEPVNAWKSIKRFSFRLLNVYRNAQ